MNRTLNRIIDFIKQHNNNATWIDEPYMAFMVEWQDWGFAKPGLAQLHLGYFSSNDGDVSFDPLFVIDFLGDAITDIKAKVFGGSVLPVSEHDPYLSEFLELVWERHFIARVGT